MITLRNAALDVGIAPLGAEMMYLRDAAGRDYLWNGDPTWWKGRAPLLFPIVGRVPRDHILVDGRQYPMRQHGLARISEFALVAAANDACTLRLESSAETLAHYPFAFRLDVHYRLDGATLHWDVEAFNTGLAPMPASVGFHPAFCWPLPGSESKAGHTVTFDEPEPAPVRQLREGLMLEASVPSPVCGRELELYEALFEADALIFDRIISRGVTYHAASSRVRVTFPGMPQLGIWSKAGAGFVCLEPWHGYAAPEDYAGELAEKPGMVVIAPGATAAFGLTISIENR